MSTLTSSRSRCVIKCGSKDKFAETGGGTPKAWAASPWRLELLLTHDVDGSLTDANLFDSVANLQSLTVIVRAQSKPPQGEDVSYIAGSTVAFSSAVTAATWAAGTAQSCALDFTSAEMNIDPGIYSLALVVMPTVGEAFEIGLSTVEILDGRAEGGAGDPEENPGEAISQLQADARYLLAGADAAASKRLAVALTNGAASEAIAFATPFEVAPAVVLCSVAVPSGGALIQSAVDQSTITAAGFTLLLPAGVPSAGYVAHILAFL